jgi:hypothetical protein
MTEGCIGVMFVNIFRFGLPVAFWRCSRWPDPLPPSCLGLLVAGLGGGVGRAESNRLLALVLALVVGTARNHSKHWVSSAN